GGVVRGEDEAGGGGLGAAALDRLDAHSLLLMSPAGRAGATVAAPGCAVRPPAAGARPEPWPVPPRGSGWARRRRSAPAGDARPRRRPPPAGSRPGPPGDGCARAGGGRPR